MIPVFLKYGPVVESFETYSVWKTFWAMASSENMLHHDSLLRCMYL